MRNLKELFQVVLNNQDTFNIGLCGWIYDLCKNGIISREESIMLKYYIANSPRPSFKYHLGHSLGFWWTPCEIEHRIEWINNQLVKLESVANFDKWSDIVYESIIVLAFFQTVCPIGETVELHIANIPNLYSRQLIIDYISNNAPNSGKLIGTSIGYPVFKISPFNSACAQDKLDCKLNLLFESVIKPLTDEEAIPNGKQNLCINKNAVVIGGHPGWTERYGWIHKGKWVDDFQNMVNNRTVQVFEEISKAEKLTAQLKEQEMKRVKLLLNNY